MISVIIPALNEEELLSKCLKSLKDQDYKGKYEVIVVDNNSRDRTKEIAESFKVKVLSCPEKGIYYARQAGAAAASGQIIAQADADTVYPENWLSEISEQFSSHPETIALSGKFSYINPPYWAWVEYFIRSFSNGFTLFFFKKPLLISGANFAFRKEAFFKIGGYNREALSFDQYDIANRLSGLGKVVYDKNLLSYTSSRRVDKGAGIILLDFASNLSRVCSYFFRSLLNNLKQFKLSQLSLKTDAKIVLVVLVVFISYGYFVPSSLVFGKVYYKASPSDKLIALTFDDGPNDPYTSQIIDILEKYNINATFFVIGKNAEKYPETIKRMIADGNAVENHSYSHYANHALTNKGCEDLKVGEEAIFKITGLKPHLYRPPFGKKSPWELECLEKENMAEVEWSASTNELHSKIFFGKVSPNLIEKNIVREAGSGKIILMHDGYGTCYSCKESDKSVTVEALPSIIESLQSQGYRFVTVPDLFDIPAYNL